MVMIFFVHSNPLFMYCCKFAFVEVCCFVDPEAPFFVHVLRLYLSIIIFYCSFRIDSSKNVKNPSNDRPDTEEEEARARTSNPNSFEKRN